MSSHPERISTSPEAGIKPATDEKLWGQETLGTGADDRRGLWCGDGEKFGGSLAMAKNPVAVWWGV